MLKLAEQCLSPLATCVVIAMQLTRHRPEGYIGIGIRPVLGHLEVHNFVWNSLPTLYVATAILPVQEVYKVIGWMVSSVVGFLSYIASYKDEVL